MLAENTDANGHPHTFVDALWWSISTITTVGYGDIFPVTPIGRLIAGLTMLVGISTFAVVTAKVAELLVRADEEAKDTSRSGYQPAPTPRWPIKDRRQRPHVR